MKILWTKEALKSYVGQQNRGFFPWSPTSCLFFYKNELRSFYRISSWGMQSCESNNMCKGKIPEGVNPVKFLGKSCKSKEAYIYVAAVRRAFALLLVPWHSSLRDNLALVVSSGPVWCYCITRYDWLARANSCEI